MDMYEDNGFTKKLDFKNQQVTVAKGDWLHLEMNLRTVVDDGENLNSVILFI